MPKSSTYHCRRRATPPHPRDTGHLKQGDGKREIGRLPRHRRRIMRCGCVFGTFWCGRGVPIARFWKPKPSEYSRPRCGTTATPFEWSKVATKRARNAIMSFLVFFRFAGAQRLGPRDPMGPKGGALRAPWAPSGPKGPFGPWGAISNGWPLRMEGNFDWNAVSNGRSF